MEFLLFFFLNLSFSVIKTKNYYVSPLINHNLARISNLDWVGPGPSSWHLAINETKGSGVQQTFQNNFHVMWCYTIVLYSERAWYLFADTNWGKCNII